MKVGRNGRSTGSRLIKIQLRPLKLIEFHSNLYHSIALLMRYQKFFGFNSIRWTVRLEKVKYSRGIFTDPEA